MTKLALLALLVLLAGCVSTTEMQLSQNVWRVQSSGQGLLAQGRTGNALFKRAAELTVQQGYTHFVIGLPDTASSTTVGGYTPVQATFSGNNVFVTGGQPIAVNRETTTALVVMSFGENGGALNARDILDGIDQE